MEKLVQHIEKLLVEHDCIVIPNLGGFIIQHEPAQLLNNTIVPPRSVISFNTDLVHTDGLLALEYAQKNKISYREAAEIIDNQIKSFQCELSKGNPILLGRIGWLRKNNDILEFTPGQNSFLPYNFGLSTLHISPKVQKSKHTTLVQSNIIKYIAASAAALLLLFATETQEPTFTEYASLNPINWATILEEKQQKEAEEKLLLAAEETSKCEEIIETIALEKSKYHIIVAALDQKSAQSYCKKMITDGFTSTHIISYKKGLHCVAIESFKSKKEAIASMQRLRNNNPEHQSAWVLCQ